MAGLVIDQQGFHALRLRTRSSHTRKRYANNFRLSVTVAVDAEMVVSGEPATCEAAVAREKAARETAERLLLEKSAELHDRNVDAQRIARKLKNANSLLAEIMAAVPDVILTCDADCVVKSCNEAAAELLGALPQSFVGKRIDDVLPGFEAQLATLRDGVVFPRAWMARRVDGREAPVDVRGHKGRIGKNIEYLLIFHDISARLMEEAERKSVERQLDEMRRLEAIGSLSAGIAHEINTPIQFIGDNLDYLRDALRTIHQSYERYETLAKAAERDGVYAAELAAVRGFNDRVRLSMLISEIVSALGESRDGISQVRDIVILMKEFAHPGTGGKDAVDLNAVLRNVVEISRNRRKGVADVEFDLDPALPAAPCRKGQVQQVLLNILINAIDAIDEAKPTRGVIRIRTSAESGYVKMMVSDNGCGVPQSLREKIYDPFFTTKPVGKGTGQGLALAKDCIIKGHQGRLSLEDVPGFATTFVIELPLAPPDAATKEESHVRAA